VENTPHVCLVGAGLCRNWQLVQRLVGQLNVTLMYRLFLDCSALTSFDVIVMDCRDGGLDGSRQLVSMLRHKTSVPIVLMDGGLSPSDVAVLIGVGAQDYFSEPFNLPIVVERLEHLARATRRRSLESEIGR
jgi:DNA-binding response OmpR family regulator